MATENLFSTPRENTLTGEQMLENAIARKQQQRENMKALTEARKLSESTEDFVATMEAAQASDEEELRKGIAMDNAVYAYGAKNIARQQIGMKRRLVQEGMEQVFNKVIGEIIYESYWLDEPVKEATVNQIEDSIGQILCYIEDKCPGAKVPIEKQNKLLKNVYSAIESVVKEAADRIVQEAIETNSAFSDFELNSEEEAKLDEKMGELGRDEIVELIKDKVAHVVQDEKQKGKERSEMFTEIDNASKEEDDTEGTEDSTGEEGEGTEESFIPTLEGGTWDTLKILCSKDKTAAKEAYKSAKSAMKKKDYKTAAKEYENAKKAFMDLKKQVQDVDESMMGTVCSFLLSGGLLEHGFIASLGGPATTVSITKVVFTSIMTALGMTIPYNIVLNMMTNQQNIDKDKKSNSNNDYKVHTIQALDTNIEACDIMIRECNKKGTNTSVKEALVLDPTDGRYTASERYISGILEAGAPFNAFEDPSWNEFKSCISLLCKKAKNLLLMDNGYCPAKAVIDELTSKLSSVPEDVPSDVKEFVMGMVSLIYTAVPTNEVIISRMGSTLGSPDLASPNPTVNYTSISWTDLLVNIKTNLASVKSYCDTKCSTATGDASIANIPNNSYNSTLESMIAQKQNQILAKNIGSSLFEAIMIGNLAQTDKFAMESAQNFSSEEVENAALIESLLQYTVFETLDTLGIYKLRFDDIKGIKKDYVNGVAEGATPIYGDSDSQTMSNGTDNTGKKKIRINTRKMKVGKDESNVLAM